MLKRIPRHSPFHLKGFRVIVDKGPGLELLTYFSLQSQKQRININAMLDNLVAYMMCIDMA